MPKAAASPLDELKDDPMRTMALMLWKNRMREPDMYVQITEPDIEAFEACMKYQRVRPTVRVERPAGLPAQAAIPAQGNRKAVPARAATAPKPYVIVALVDQRGDAIKPIENNQADYDIAQDVARVRRARDNAPSLAQQLLAQARSGEFSLAVMQECADALVLLSRAG